MKKSGVLSSSQGFNSKKDLVESQVSLGSENSKKERSGTPTILKINRLQSSNSIKSRETPKNGVGARAKNTLEGFNLLQPGQQNSGNLTIQKFGLSMEPICQNKSHDRSKIQFICTDLNIHGRLRTGCAQCMLEQHKDNPDSVIKIDDFVRNIKQKYSEYYDSLRELKDFSGQLENPDFMTMIEENLEQLKQIVCKKVDGIRQQISNQLKSEISEDYLQFSSLVRSQKHFSSQVELAIQKNFLNLSNEDLDTLTQLLHDQPMIQIDKYQEKLKSKLLQTEKSFMIGTDNLINNLNLQFNHILSHYDKLELPPQLDDKSVLRLDLIQKKEAKEKLLIDTQNLKQEIDALQKQIFELEKDMGMHIKPHTHLKEDHLTTVPIFECCQQAFKCIQCHDNFSKDHKAYLTNPSKRYCMSCQRIFTVIAYTDLPVICVHCQIRPH